MVTCCLSLNGIELFVRNFACHAMEPDLEQDPGLDEGTPAPSGKNKDLDTALIPISVDTPERSRDASLSNKTPFALELDVEALSIADLMNDGDTKMAPISVDTPEKKRPLAKSKPTSINSPVDVDLISPK